MENIALYVVDQWLAAFRDSLNETLKRTLVHWKKPDPMISSTLYNAALPCVSVVTGSERLFCPDVFCDMSIFVVTDYLGDDLEMKIVHEIHRHIRKLRTENLGDFSMAFKVRESKIRCPEKKIRQVELIYDVKISGLGVLDILQQEADQAGKRGIKK